ncbi:MAG: PP2C family protein-serine/threonine phosphatase [Spirochaetota bacterium]
MEKSLLSLLAESYSYLPGYSGLKYFAILSNNTGSTEIIYMTKNDNFDPVQPKLKELLKENEEENKVLDGSFKDSGINFHLLRFKDSTSFYLMIQDDSDITADKKELLVFIRENIHMMLLASFSASNERYKEQLSKLREFQARLFPKFNDVKSLDISSVYLPADLMSGNFIDAFFLNDNVYQIALCSVDGYDASSSFTAATIRTLIRTNAKRMSPSGQLHFVMGKIEKVIAGLHSLIYLTVIQINTKSGDCRLSSLGPPNVLHISAKNRKMTSTNDSPSGKILTRRKDYQDILFHMDQGDTLLYYSNGVMKAASPSSGAAYSLRNIVLAVRDCLDESALFITHSISDSIYEFTEYAHYEEDIILLAAKRTSPE